MSWRRAPAGLVSGPRTLNRVRTPSSRRTPITSFIAGWKSGAKRKAMPISSRARPAPSGAISTSTPSAASTSALPERDDTERLPCLATATPPAAATRAAAVEMLKVWRPSPPVPQVSTTVAARMDHRRHPRAHRGGGAGDLLGGLPLHPQRHQQRRLQRIADQAVHQRAEDVLHLAAAEVAAVEQAVQGARGSRSSPAVPSCRALPRTGAGSWRAAPGPLRVSTDSGWNWTPR